MEGRRGVVLTVTFLEWVGAGEDVGAVLAVVAVLVGRQREELLPSERELHGHEHVAFDQLSERRGVQPTDVAAEDRRSAVVIGAHGRLAEMRFPIHAMHGTAMEFPSAL